MRHRRGRSANVGLLLAAADQGDSRPTPRRTSAAYRDPGAARLLPQLAVDNDPYERASAARHYAASPTLLRQLAQGPMSDGRAAAASNPSCPPAVVALLAKDRQEDVVDEIIGRERCPAAALVTAAGNPSSDYPYKRVAAVAGHRDCPAEMLRRLARNRSRHIRTAVAANPNCPPELLAAAAGNPSPSAAPRQPGTNRSQAAGQPRTSLPLNLTAQNTPLCREHPAATFDVGCALSDASVGMQ